MGLMDKAEDVVIITGVTLAAWWAWNNTNIFDGIKNMFGIQGGNPSGGSPPTKKDESNDYPINTGNTTVDKITDLWWEKSGYGGAAKTGTEIAEAIKESANNAGKSINSWLFPTQVVKIPNTTLNTAYGPMPSLYGGFVGSSNGRQVTQSIPEYVQRAIAEAPKSMASATIMPAATGAGFVGLTKSTQPQTVMNATGKQPLFVPMGVDTQTLNRTSTVYMNTNTGVAFHLGGR